MSFDVRGPKETAEGSLEGRARSARPLGFSVSSLCLRPEPWAAQKRGAVGALTSGTFRPASPVLLSEQRVHCVGSALMWRFVAGGDNGLRRRQEGLLGELGLRATCAWSVR